MKKTLFAALALAFVASCSNEEVLDVAQKEAIGFDNAFINNSTRSVSDPSYSSTADEGKGMFADFKIFGFVGTEGAALFAAEGETVSKTIINDKLSSEWKYSATQYWINGASYAFHAVAPATGWGTPTATKDGVSFSFTNTDGTNDILYATATATGAASNNQAVGLTFNHILSKVKFSFKNAYNGSNSSIRVREIKITNAYSTGSVALPAKTWTTNNTNATLVLNFGNAATSTANAEEAFVFDKTVESYNELLLIPNAVENGYNVTFIVDLLVSDKVIDTYNHTATVDFIPVAGYAYNINAEITHENIDPDNKQEPIEFTVTAITDWVEPNNVNATVNTNTTSGN